MVTGVKRLTPDLFRTGPSMSTVHLPHSRLGSKHTEVSPRISDMYNGEDFLLGRRFIINM